MRSLDYKKQFSKDLSKLQKSGRVDLDELGKLIDQIASGIPLDKKYKDHALVKTSPKHYQGCRDFHYRANVCVIYRLTTDVMELIRIGSHQDLGLTEGVILQKC